MLPPLARDVLISLQFEYAVALLNGSKCVELRRRPPRLAPGTRVWFYAKVPVGKVLGFGMLNEIVVAAPSDLWTMYQQCSGVPKAHFDSYFSGLESAAAMRFSAVTVLEEQLTLADLRRLQPAFQPPQFYVRLPASLVDRLHSSAWRQEQRVCLHEAVTRSKSDVTSVLPR